MISVIIPTCNRNDLLAKCLGSLSPFNQQIDNTLYEVIVTDDGVDNQAKVLITNKFPWVKWVEGPKRGPAANRNNGAKYAKGEWIVFLDDDVLPDCNLINAYTYVIDNSLGFEAFEGAIFPDDWLLLKLDMAECPVNTSGGCFWSANVCIKKTLFFKVEGFDEQFTIPAQEDQDIYERLKVYTQVPFLIDAFITHPVRIASFKKKIQTSKQTITNWLKFQQKNKSLFSCFYLGYKSQLFSVINNFKKGKTKSLLYNIYILIIFPFVVLISKINKNV